MTDFRIDKPQGSDSPNELDTILQGLFTGLQERLNVDHDFTLSGNYVVPVSSGAGNHRQITFGGVLSANPTLLSGESALFTKSAANADTVNVSEIFISTKPLTADATTDILTGRQLTKGAALNILAADVEDVLNADTMEVNASDEIAVAVPAAGADATALTNSVHAYGKYTGNGTSQTIAVGFMPRYLVIRRTTTNQYTTAMIALSDSDFHTFAEGNTGNLNDILEPYYDESDTDQTEWGFTVTGSNTRVNANGAEYYWYAAGEKVVIE